MVDLNLTTLNYWLNKQEAVEHSSSLTELTDWLFKAVSAESVAEAKRKGLVPQSGDWEKPRRWVRPEDADVVVEEPDAPRVYSYDEVKKFVEDKISLKFDFDEMREKHGRRNIFDDDDPEDDYYLGYDQIEDIIEVTIGAIDGGEEGPTPKHVYEGFGEPKKDAFGRPKGGREGKRTIPKWQLDRFTGNFQLEWDESPGDGAMKTRTGGEFNGVAAHCDINANIVLWRTKHHVTYGRDYPHVRHQHLAETVVHELGHAIVSDMRGDVPSWVMAHLRNAYNKSVESGKGFVSKYSAVNQNEFFAESFKDYIVRTDFLERTNPEMFELLEILNQADSLDSLHRPFTEEEYDKYDLKNIFSPASEDFKEAFGTFELWIGRDSEFTGGYEGEELVKARSTIIKNLSSSIRDSIGAGYTREDLMGYLQGRIESQERMNKNMEAMREDETYEKLSEDLKEMVDSWEFKTFDEQFPNSRPIFEELIDSVISNDYPDYGNVEPWISMYGRKDVDIKKQASHTFKPMEREHLFKIEDPIEVGYPNNEETVREASEFIREQKEKLSLSKQAHDDLRPMNPPSRPPHKGAVWNPDTHRWSKGGTKDLDKQQTMKRGWHDHDGQMPPHPGNVKDHETYFEEQKEQGGDGESDKDKEKKAEEMMQPKGAIAQKLKKFNDKVDKILKTIDDFLSGRVDNPQQTFDDLAGLKEEVDQEIEEANNKIDENEEKVNDLHESGKIDDSTKEKADSELEALRNHYKEQENEVNEKWDENYEKLKEKLEAQEKNPMLEDDEEGEEQSDNEEESEEEPEISTEDDALKLIDKIWVETKELREARNEAEKRHKELEDELERVKEEGVDKFNAKDWEELNQKLTNTKNKIESMDKSIKINNKKALFAESFLEDTSVISRRDLEKVGSEEDIFAKK